MTLPYKESTFLYVLHQSDFDKAVATGSRQPISNLTIFEYESLGPNAYDLTPLKTIHGFSQYTRSIIRPLQGSDDGKYSLTICLDFVFVTAGHGFYVIRQDKSSFVQTTSLSKLIDDANAKHKQPEKNVVFPPGELVVSSVIDCMKEEVRFDGVTRAMSIGNRKLLVMTERGQR